MQTLVPFFIYFIFGNSTSRALDLNEALERFLD